MPASTKREPYSGRCPFRSARSTLPALRETADPPFFRLCSSLLWLTQSLDQERRVFAVDMRNHGASSHHESMTYVDMANDVLGFLADKVRFVVLLVDTTIFLQWVFFCSLLGTSSRHY